MNIILFEAEEILPDQRVCVRGPRAEHIERILKAKSADVLKAGVVNGPLGSARVEKILEGQVDLLFQPEAEPPAPAQVKLILALPRPKALKRVLANVTTLGIKQIHLIHACRVEKPYWSSEHLGIGNLRAACVKGLEQARDTMMPQIHLHKLFRPFVEDELPQITKGTHALVAHPGGGSLPTIHQSDPVTLVIGPEGGFVPFEIDLLKGIGFKPIHLGDRILTVETAISYSVGCLRGCT